MLGSIVSHAKMAYGLLSNEGEGLNLINGTMPPSGDIDSVEDTVTYLGKLADWVKDYATDVIIPVAIKLAIAVLIFIICKFVIKKLIVIMDKSLRRSSIEEGTIHFLNSLAKGVGFVLAIAICATYLNVGSGAIVAVLGSAGLAVGLSLQGSLANFAGGIILLITKPFGIGDYIIALGNEGVVTGIDIVHTTLLTGDNKKIVLPNGSLSSANIVNVTYDEKRRLDLTVGVDYNSDIVQVKTILEKVAREEELVMQNEEVTVFVGEFGASAINMGLRVWTKCENYWQAKWNIQEKIKLKFDEEGISIPYDHVDVTISKED